MNQNADMGTITAPAYRRFPALWAALTLLFLLAAAPASRGEDGFVSLFDGAGLNGWTWTGRSGQGYVVQEGLLVCPAGGRGNLFTEKEYSDFVLRFEFRLSPGANNGVGIRAPLQGRASRLGMEIQLLDDAAPRNARLKPAQYHGSIYEVVPAKRGALKPAGEWNEQEIQAVGRRVKVTLNGQVILDANLDEVTDPAILELHPGLRRERGHIGFLGHGNEVAFRNIRIRDLSAADRPGEIAKTRRERNRERGTEQDRRPADAVKEHTVIVSAPNRGYREVPVTVTVAAPSGFEGVAVWRGDARVPSQVRRDGDRAHVTWVARDLKQGDAIRYRLAFEKAATPARAASTDAASGVAIERKGENLEIRVNNELFTRYDTTTGPNKPYLYPVIGPGGRLMTRRYPLENAAGESRDHPHHRGLWFTHDPVNHANFWTEGPNAAKTVHRKYETIESGPVYGGFRAVTDWIGPDGKKVCEDVRDVRVYNTAAGRLLDWQITIRAADSPVVFGDSKEGTFGIRLPDTMRVRGGGGHIETSAGLKDAAAWGKRAAWVDYYGPVDNTTVGIAILDHPTNFRHPTWWHVRDYGLFAANPFGIHDFEPGQPSGAGNHTLPPGATLTFRYRLYLHEGTTADARVADVWTAYADPPRVEVR